MSVEIIFDRFCREISEKKNIDINVVRKIARSQFLYVVYIMDTGRLEAVQLTYLGKFAVKPRKLRRTILEGLPPPKIKHDNDGHLD